MSLKPCRECKQEVSNKAKTCPHCGVKNPASSFMRRLLRLLLIIFGIFFVLGLIGAIVGEPPEKTTTEDSTPATEAEAPDPAPKVEPENKPASTQEEPKQEPASSNKDTQQSTVDSEEEQCKQDLQCWGSRNSTTASVYCPDYIERLAKYDARWTDGVFESKFSHFSWNDKAKGIVNYFGDKVQFQNGFGAWQTYTYSCTVDTINRKVLDFSASAGRIN